MTQNEEDKKKNSDKNIFRKERKNILLSTT